MITKVLSFFDGVSVVDIFFIQTETIECTQYFFSKHVWWIQHTHTMSWVNYGQVEWNLEPHSLSFSVFFSCVQLPTTTIGCPHYAFAGLNGLSMLCQCSKTNDHLGKTQQKVGKAGGGTQLLRDATLLMMELL